LAHLGDLGADRSFLIVPNLSIAGNLRGKRLGVCSGDHDHHKECYPNLNAAWDFKVGDVIDFSWGMTEGQVGELMYAIVPSGIL